MKIRIKKYGVEIWDDISTTPRVSANGEVEQRTSINWRVRTIYFNPIEQLKQFIWTQIDEAFRKYAKNQNKTNRKKR
jgi:hypothetical protein